MQAERELNKPAQTLAQKPEVSAQNQADDAYGNPLERPRKARSGPHHKRRIKRKTNCRKPLFDNHNSLFLYDFYCHSNVIIQPKTSNKSVSEPSSALPTRRLTGGTAVESTGRLPERHA
jgi:hypothetical protein